MSQNTRSESDNRKRACSGISNGRSHLYTRLLRIAFVVLASLGFATAALADLARIPWEDLPERVADRLLPIEELRIAAWPEARDAVDPEPATVLQFIENTLYEWEEHEIVDAAGDVRICLRMIRPEARDLTLTEAQVLLSGSGLFLDPAPAPHHEIVLDANDPLFDVEVENPVLDDDDPAWLEEPIPADDLFDEGLDNAGGGAVPSGGTDAAPRRVQGTDDRTRVSDTNSHPYRTIAYLSSTFPNGMIFRGTGTLIGPRTVLTNGHVVYDSEIGGYASSIRVSPAQWQNSAGGQVHRPFGTKTSSNVATDPAYIQSPSFAYDYAAVFLSEPFAGISTYMPLVFDASPSSINIAGYPASVQDVTNNKGMWHSGSSVLQVTTRLLFYTADSSGGNSGGPVWQYLSSTGLRRIVGVHALGMPGENGGPRLCSQNRTLIRQWLSGGGSGGGVQQPGNKSDFYEPDNNSGQASRLSRGTSQTHSIVAADDHDWFRFTLWSTSDVEIETSGSTGDTRIWLYDESLNQVDFDDNGSGGLFSKIDATGLETGTYYVKVDEYGNDKEIATYEISLSVTRANGGTVGGPGSGPGTSLLSPISGGCGVAAPLTLTATLAGIFGFGTRVRRRRF